MEESCEPKKFLDALARWREGCVFYFKFDLALFAFVAALVSFFKIEGYEIIAYVFQYKMLLHYLAMLIIYALLFELAITNTSNRKDLSQILEVEVKSNRIYRIFNRLYGIQVLAHAALVLFMLGYISGFVDAFADCITGNSACGI